MSEVHELHISVDTDDRTAADADIEVRESDLRIAFRVGAGHLPAGTRERLVREVFEVVASSPGGRVRVSIPLGDTELLDAVREHCRDVDIRPTGSTCLIDGTIAPGR